MKCKIGKTTVVVERGDITEAEVDAAIDEGANHGRYTVIENHLQKHLVNDTEQLTSESLEEFVT